MIKMTNKRCKTVAVEGRVRQSVRQSPACERIVVGVCAGHWLILRGCPAERWAVGLVSGVSAGHFGGAGV